MASIIEDDIAIAQKEEPRRSERQRRRSRTGASRVDYKVLAGEVEADDNENTTILGIDDRLQAILEKNNIDIHQYYANRHVPHILLRQFDPTESVVQIVHDGSTLTASALKSSDCNLTISRPIVVTDTPESLGMVVPKPKIDSIPTARYYHCPPQERRDVTVRDIAEIVGVGHAVTVMDVKHQEELDGWTLGDLMDYFEDEDRLRAVENQKQWLDWWIEATKRYQQQQQGGVDQDEDVAFLFPPPPTVSKQQQQHRVLNQISLEFSHTPLVHQTRSPAFVRDLDWIDNIWPTHLKAIGDYPRVQYYCLTSTAGCYTDFHVDFGGTSVWYHILSGSKVFLLVPPSKGNLQVYEDWLCSQNQSEVFYPDLPKVKGVYRVVLNRGQTLVIPTGYIHAVYTPEDSVVIGGNFLHGLGVEGQLDVHCLETRTRVPAKFRFPHFVGMMHYAGADYLKRIMKNEVCEAELNGIDQLADALQTWAVQPGGDADRVGSVAHTARECLQQCDCDDVTKMVNLMKKEKQQWCEKQKERSGRNLKLSLKLSLDTGDVTKSAASKGVISLQKPKLSINLTKNKTLHSSEKEQFNDNVNGYGNNDTAINNDVEDDLDTPSDFKIVLPPNPSMSIPSATNNAASLNGITMKRRRTHHTDLNPYRGSNGNGEGEDDEWVPGGRKRKKKQPKKKVKLSLSTRLAATVTAQPNQGNNLIEDKGIFDDKYSALHDAAQGFTSCDVPLTSNKIDHIIQTSSNKKSETKKHEKTKPSIAANSGRSKIVSRAVSKKMTARERLKKRMGF
mmetsp:Transcript_31775/g.46732  ORF Transcript_31775/g.46732 Transcript_31775/m.46732 type:complete len:787 (-) Transcript_31775:68-2428(-)